MKPFRPHPGGGFEGVAGRVVGRVAKHDATFEFFRLLARQPQQFGQIDTAVYTGNEQFPRHLLTQQGESASRRSDPPVRRRWRRSPSRVAPMSGTSAAYQNKPASQTPARAGSNDRKKARERERNRMAVDQAWRQGKCARVRWTVALAVSMASNAARAGRAATAAQPEMGSDKSTKPSFKSVGSRKLIAKRTGMLRARPKKSALQSEHESAVGELSGDVVIGSADQMQDLYDFLMDGHAGARRIKDSGGGDAADQQDDTMASHSILRLRSISLASQTR